MADRKPPLANRARYREDDPMRYLHVPRSKRLDEDEGDFSDATDEITGEVDEFDREAVRKRGGVVPESELS